MEFDEDDNCVGGLVPKFGAIFMSNGATKKECLKRKIFGLPLAKANFVKQVKSGMILFLFEFEKRELYGVFQATSDGTMHLNPHAFTSSGKQFPAQVQIAPIWSCHPLPEVVFRDAIKDNYYSSNKFHFGLSAQQVRVLLHLFYCRKLNNRMPPRQIADKMTRKAGNKRHKTDDRIMVTTTSEQEKIDCIKSPYLRNSLLGLVGVDREALTIEDRFKSVHDVGNSTEPDFLPVFPSYITLSEDIVVADDYRFGKDDRLENACDVESCIRPNFTSGLVSNDALNITVPYDPEFPDIKYQCSSQILDSAQDLSAHQVHDENFVPLSTSECVPHEAALGSLYSEAPVVKASVFSRLSVAPRKHKKEDNGIHDEDDRLASIDEIMDTLHQAQNRWVKGSFGEKSKYVYVRCEEEAKFSNHLQVKQPVVTKEMTADVEFLIEEECDIVPKETRVVDFKRRSKKNKYLVEMVSKVSAGTTMGRSSTTVDATGEGMAGKAGKKRKLIRPYFKKEQSHESGDILRKFEGKEKIDELNSQVISIQDPVSSLASGSCAQEQLSFISGVTSVPKNFEEEETADINH